MTENEKFECAIHCAKYQAGIEVCEDCKAYNMDSSTCKEIAMEAIKALEEAQRYRKIGTVEECRKAVEKQKPKKPIKSKDGNLCCSCGLVLQIKGVRKALYYCTNCGKKIDWSEEEKGE